MSHPQRRPDAIQNAYTGSNITRESMYAALNGDMLRNAAALRASKAFAAAVNAFLGEATCLTTRAKCRLEIAGIQDGVPSIDGITKLREAGKHLETRPADALYVSGGRHLVACAPP